MGDVVNSSVTNPQMACLDTYVKQKVTRDADIPDVL